MTTEVSASISTPVRSAVRVVGGGTPPAGAPPPAPGAPGRGRAASGVDYFTPYLVHFAATEPVQMADAVALPSVTTFSTFLAVT